MIIDCTMPPAEIECYFTPPPILEYPDRKSREALLRKSGLFELLAGLPPAEQDKIVYGLWMEARSRAKECIRQFKQSDLDREQREEALHMAKWLSLVSIALGELYSTMRYKDILATRGAAPHAKSEEGMVTGDGARNASATSHEAHRPVAAVSEGTQDSVPPSESDELDALLQGVRQRKRPEVRQRKRPEVRQRKRPHGPQVRQRTRPPAHQGKGEEVRQRKRPSASA